MRNSTGFRIAGLAAAAVLAVFATTPALAQPRDIDRSNRIRQHEQRIKQIIENRRIEAVEREKKEREAREAEQRQQQEQQQQQQQQPAEAQQQPPGGVPPGQAPAVDPATLEPPPQEGKKAISSVVMGFKFINDEGLADYNTIVREGQTFITEVTLFNIDHNPIERLRLALDYDKRFIEPVKVFDTELRKREKEPAKFSLDDENAQILYDSTLAKPMEREEVVLLRILWKAKRQTPYTGISFAFDELEEEGTPHTAIYARGKNILGIYDDPADGVLSGGLMIDTPNGDGEEVVLQGKGEELKKLYLGSVASDAEVGLKLVGPRQTPKVGKPFIVKVALNNPDGALVDALDFYVKYDPQVLQVIDSDKFNWVNRGVNVLDGPYHTNFPWDMHKRNEVRNSRGQINYQVALSNGASLPSKTVASIKFVAIAPTQATEIQFVPGKLSEYIHTSVRYFGYERLNLKEKYSHPILKFPVEAAPPPVEKAKEPEPAVVAAGPESEGASSVKSLKIVRD